MADIIGNMEDSIFRATCAKLTRLTGFSPDPEFLRDMLGLVRKQYVAELQMRKIRLRAMDSAHLDEMISYIFYYHRFHTAGKTPEQIAAAEKDEKYRAMLVHDVAVYIVINEHLNVEKLSNTSEYSPEIVAVNMACSYSLFLLGSFRGEDPRMRGMNNLFKKSLVTCKGVVRLLAGGNSCDAVILWRHLHELECVLIILSTKGEDLFLDYVRHMEFYDMENNPDPDGVAKRLSEECKKFGIKERNAYINYGWLAHVDGFIEGYGKEYRLNFRDGLQKVAGQTHRYAAYSSASKILHPSAWIVAIRDDKFYTFTMFELFKSIVNIARQINCYAERYAEFSLRSGECALYGKTMGAYLNMIARNNQVIAARVKKPGEAPAGQE